jgi:uncharacterized membrane protein
MKIRYIAIPSVAVVSWVVGASAAVLRSGVSTPIEDWRLVLFAPFGIGFGTDGAAQLLALVAACIFVVLAFLLRKKLHGIVPLLSIALLAGTLGCIGADRLLTIAHSI